MDFSEKWGKDVEDAVKLALHDLKLERDQVEVIVLEEPTKGFFGLGSKLAKVRVQRRVTSGAAAEESGSDKSVAEKAVKKRIEPIEPHSEPPAEKEKKERPDVKDADQKEKPKKPRNKRRDNRVDSKNSFIFREKPVDLQEVEDAPALDFLRDVTLRMGLSLTIKPYANESCLYFDISGPDSGTIIGKRGQTLDSIQYLTSLVANKDREKYLRVIVDAENYRSKRERTLEQLANRLGDKVLKSGKSVRLEPMNPYERKVIHATLQKNAGVTTRSEGEEPYRRVIIEKK